MDGHLDRDWFGDPFAAFGNALEYRDPLVVPRGGKHRAQRLKSLGNAVVPQVVLALFMAIRDADERG